jgi:hypothetical protein
MLCAAKVTFVPLHPAVIHAVPLLCHTAEEEFQGFKLKGGNRAAANVPGPLPRYGSSAGLHYMLAAAPAKQVRRSWGGGDLGHCRVQRCALAVPVPNSSESAPLHMCCHGMVHGCPAIFV